MPPDSGLRRNDVQSIMLCRDVLLAPTPSSISLNESCVVRTRLIRQLALALTPPYNAVVLEYRHLAYNKRIERSLSVHTLQLSET